MKIYKFTIPAEDPRTDRGGDTWIGMGAAVVAESADQARAVLREFGAERAEGRVGWLDVADVTEIEIKPGAVALWAEV